MKPDKIKTPDPTQLSCYLEAEGHNVEYVEEVLLHYDDDDSKLGGAFIS